MHFRINEKNTISDFHIERWDFESLGKELVNNIESYINKSPNEFILFALKNRLFLKTRMLFSMSEKENKESIYFWTCSPIYGEENLKSIRRMASTGIPKDSMKYAEFNLNLKNNEDDLEPSFFSVLYDSTLASIFKENGYLAEKYLFDVSDEELKAISFEFNISRNRINSIYLTDSKSYREGRMIGLPIESPAFTVLEKSGALKVFREDMIEDMLKQDFSECITLQATQTNNEVENLKVKEILEKIDHNVKAKKLLTSL